MTEHTDPLTPVQEQVVAAIAGGATLQAAAGAAQIHRNTIGYWRRTSIAFRQALAHAHYDKALLLHEQAEDYAGDAWAAIKAILNDPNAPAGVRLNAAKYIIEKATTPPPPDPEPAYHMEMVSMFPNQTPHSPAQKPVEPMHKNAQTMHKNAQTPVPQVGRNTPCPCGSGLKFKRCCLGKRDLPAAA